MSRLRFRSALRLLLAVPVMLSSVGCASWKPVTEQPLAVESAARQVPENKRRLTLDVEFAHRAPNSLASDVEPDLWQWVDETAVDAETRRRLLANGIRVGVVSDRERFRQQLSGDAEQGDVLDQFLSEASIASDLAQGSKRIPMRFGRRYELPLRQPIQGEHTTLLRLDGQTIGRTLSHAQHVMAITAGRSDKTHQVEMRFQLEIQHGETRQKFVSSDTALRIDNRRETWSLDSLDVNLTAREGDTIVFGPAKPLTGLAKEMLSGETSDQQQEQTVLLLTVAQIPTAVDKL